MKTADADMERRLARLKTRRTVEGKSDEYLTVILDDALCCFLEVTHRKEDPGEDIDSLVTEMANHWSNMEGAEYTEGASESDISRTWTALPEALYKRMTGYRRMSGLVAESDDE